MLKKWTMVSVVAIALVLPTLALAQPEAGNWELTLAGRGSNDDDFDDGAFLIGAKVGYFYTKEIEIFLRQDIDILYNQGGDAGFFTAVGVDYHFDLDQWQPFVGAQIGMFYGDDTIVEDTGAFGPEIGVKYFVNNTTFIYGEVGWIWFFDESESGDEDDSRWTYAVGIGFQW
jgi:hypothetical protein